MFDNDIDTEHNAPYEWHSVQLPNVLWKASFMNYKMVQPCDFRTLFSHIMVKQ